MKKVFVTLLAVIILLCSMAVVVNSVANSQYWSSSHLQDFTLELGEYADLIANGDSSLSEIEATVHECNESAEPVSDDLSLFFDACNELIFSYFQDIYSVDVSEKLNALRVFESTYPEEVSQMVGGPYSSDFPERLFMNSALLESCVSEIGEGKTPDVTSNVFSVKMLRTVYIHEVIHYLGFNRGLGFERFTEALAECLNEKVTLHGGIKYESITGYAAIQGYASQIVDCDPELVKKVLTEEDFNMSEYFNNKLGDKSGTNYAEYYDCLIGLIQKGGSRDLNKLTYYTQYLTYEYCKTSNSGARNILKEANENSVSLFEVKWLLGIY